MSCDGWHSATYILHNFEYMIVYSKIKTWNTAFITNGKRKSWWILHKWSIWGVSMLPVALLIWIWCSNVLRNPNSSQQYVNICMKYWYLFEPMMRQWTAQHACLEVWILIIDPSLILPYIDIRSKLSKDSTVRYWLYAHIYMPSKIMKLAKRQSYKLLKQKLPTSWSRL